MRFEAPSKLGHTYTYVYIYIYMHHIYIYIYIYIYTHTHSWYTSHDITDIPWHAYLFVTKSLKFPRDLSWSCEADGRVYSSCRMACEAERMKAWWFKERDHRKMMKHVELLVGGLEHEFYFSIQLGIIIPTDFHIFQRGWNHQPV